MNLTGRKHDLDATLAAARAERARIAYAVEFEGASPTLLDDAINSQRAAEARLESLGIAVAVAADQADQARAAEVRAVLDQVRADALQADELALPAADRVDAALTELIDAWGALDRIRALHADSLSTLARADGVDTYGLAETQSRFPETFKIRIASILARGDLMLPDGEIYVRESDRVDGRPSEGHKTVAELVANRLTKARALARQPRVNA